MEIITKKISIREKREMENTIADNATLKANLDYVAMMANIDIPSESEVTNNVVSEN